MKRSLLKKRFVAAALLCFYCSLVSGCLIADKQTVEMRLISPQKGMVTYIYYGIKSDSDNEDEIKKDFDDLAGLVSEEARANAFEHDKIRIERWNIDIDQKGNVYGAVEATFNIDEFFSYNDYQMSNGEIIIVLPMAKDLKLTSNGKVIKTENNYVLIWPQDEKHLQWTIVDKHSKKYPNNLNKLLDQINQE